MQAFRSILIWVCFSVAVSVPALVAATSPFLAYRDTIYVVAGFAGIAAMSLLLAQPLLAAGYLPGLSRPRGRRVHRWVGVALVGAVVLHVGGLWLTSPPDVIDALTFSAPTWFSVWGVIAMWALFAAAALAALRKRARLRPIIWRLGHSGLVSITVFGGIAHALLIEGTMGTMTKAALCALVVAATATAIADLRPWAGSGPAKSDAP